MLEGEKKAKAEKRTCSSSFSKAAAEGARKSSLKGRSKDLRLSIGEMLENRSRKGEREIRWVSLQAKKRMVGRGGKSDF